MEPVVRFLRRVAAAVAAALMVSTGCGVASETSDRTWAAEAEGVIGLLAESYDLADPYQTGRFFTAGGTLDMSVWGLGVATTPDEVVEQVRRLWFMDPGYASVRADHLFVSPHGAVVWWSAYDDRGGNDWIQTYFFGSRGQTASVTFGQDRGWPADRALVSRYRQAWEERDVAALAAVYAPGAVVLNQVSGDEWRSAVDLLAAVDEGPPVQPGPHPGAFFYRLGADLQAIVLVQLGGDCPMLEARRLVFAGDSIVKETRFTHVPSAQRCLSDLGDGWWSSFELPVDLQARRF